MRAAFFLARQTVAHAARLLALETEAPWGPLLAPRPRGGQLLPESSESASRRRDVQVLTGARLKLAMLSIPARTPGRVVLNRVSQPGVPNPEVQVGWRIFGRHTPRRWELELEEPGLLTSVGFSFLTEMPLEPVSSGLRVRGPPHPHVPTQRVSLSYGYIGQKSHC